MSQEEGDSVFSKKHTTDVVARAQATLRPHQVQALDKLQVHFSQATSNPALIVMPTKAVDDNLIKDIDFVEVVIFAEQAPSLHQEEEDELPFDAAAFLKSNPKAYVECAKLQKEWEQKNNKEDNQPFDSDAYLAKNGMSSQSLKKCGQFQKASDERQVKLLAKAKKIESRTAGQAKEALDRQAIYEQATDQQRRTYRPLAAAVREELGKHDAVSSNKFHQAMVTVADIEETKLFSQEYNLGVEGKDKCCPLTSSLTPAEKKTVVKRFRAGEFRTLIVFECLKEGFDHNKISVVGIAAKIKETRSTFFAQFVGRAVRKDADDPDELKAIVVSHRAFDMRKMFDDFKAEDVVPITKVAPEDVNFVPTVLSEDEDEEEEVEAKKVHALKKTKHTRDWDLGAKWGRSWDF